MSAPMPTWLIIAALATIGVTALLVAILYRINLAADEPKTAGREAVGGDE
jgi:hypothetical protein